MNRLTVVGLGLVLLGGVGAWCWHRSSGLSDLTSYAPEKRVSSLEEKIHRSCSRCHAFPRPEVLPGPGWRHVIEKMFSFLGREGKQLDGLFAEEVIDWYEARAPESWDLHPVSPESRPGPLRFRKHGFTPPGAPPSPAISHLTFVRHSSLNDPTLLVSDMRHGLVFRVTFTRDSMRIGGGGPTFVRLGQVPHPCRSELCDFDGDGIPEILVADLGSFLPEDHDRGTVSLFRSEGGLPLKRYVLAAGLGRVSDVRPADLDGDGDLDVAVGVFGWNETGRILWLENRTTDWSPGKAPVFTPHRIDARHGVIHLPVLDLDGDGRLDLLAQFSQEYEEVVAFANRGGGRFEARTLDRAPHPAWGSNGLTVADLDGDGDPDLILSNGDALDVMTPKNYHGIRWLENLGSGGWRAHDLARIYAVHGVRAVDLDGDGDLDLVAAAFFPAFEPGTFYPEYGFPSVVWLEQEAPGRFRTWVIERRHPVHATLDVGDVDGDGDLDLVTGSFRMDLPGLAGVDWPTGSPWIEVWLNERR